VGAGAGVGETAETPHRRARRPRVRGVPSAAVRRPRRTRLLIRSAGSL